MILVYELSGDYSDNTAKKYYKKATDFHVDDRDNLILSDDEFADIAVIRQGYWLKAKRVKKKKLTANK